MPIAEGATSTRLTPEAVNGLLEDWDDAAADALFTENVAQDRPYAERRGDLALLKDRIGVFAVDPARAAESETPAHRRWWLTGERGTVAVAIQPAAVENLHPAVVPTTTAAPIPVPTAIAMWATRDTSCRRIEGIRIGHLYPIAGGTTIGNQVRPARPAAAQPFELERYNSAGYFGVTR